MLRMARPPLKGLDDAGRERLEHLIRDDYARSHPRDTLGHLKRRARFSKQDAGLLREWLEVARHRAAGSPSEDLRGRHGAAA